MKCVFLWDENKLSGSGIFPEFTDDLQGFRAMNEQLSTFLLQVQSSISNSEKISSANSRILVNLPFLQVVQDVLIF